MSFFGGGGGGRAKRILRGEGLIVTVERELRDVIESLHSEAA